MSRARDEILARVQRARRATTGGAMPPAEVCKEVPATGWAGRAARFRARAIAASATVAEVAAADGVAAEVRRYLASLGLPPEVRISAAPPGLSAGLVDGLRCDAGVPRPDGDTLVTGCFAAVAGEGVVVLASGPAHAPESAFLAATHVVVVEPAQLVDSLESLWARLRGLVRPRMLNLVLGPSRTADLGVPSRLGAHGPLRVHVILITGED